MSTTWHVDDAMWTGYLRGSLAPLAEGAVEQHLLGCPQCQAAANTRVAAAAESAAADIVGGAVLPIPATDDLWDSVHLEIARPRLSRALRWAVRRGMREDEATLLATGRDLALSSTVALAAAAVCALLTSLPVLRHLTPEAVFLVFAPLVPLFAVAATYDVTDPLREVTATTPFSALRLSLLRASAALVTAVPLTALLGALIPGVGAAAAAWLLPGLALAVAGLVLLTWTTARIAAGVSGSLWLVGALGAARASTLDVLTAFGGQVAAALVLGALTLVLLQRSTVQTSFPGVHR